MCTINYCIYIEESGMGNEHKVRKQIFMTVCAAIGGMTGSTKVNFRTIEICAY